MNAALKHCMDDMHTYHVASLVHPLVLLEVEMFLTVQEDLKNQQMTILIHFNQTLNSDECRILKKGMVWCTCFINDITAIYSVATKHNKLKFNKVLEKCLDLLIKTLASNFGTHNAVRSSKCLLCCE